MGAYRKACLLGSASATARRLAWSLMLRALTKPPIWRRLKRWSVGCIVVRDGGSRLRGVVVSGETSGWSGGLGRFLLCNSGGDGNWRNEEDSSILCSLFTNTMREGKRIRGVYDALDEGVESLMKACWYGQREAIHKRSLSISPFGPLSLFSLSPTSSAFLPQPLNLPP